MAQVVVGRQWRQFSDEQKSTFVEMFSKLSVATHAARFDGFSGQRFEIRSDKKLSEKINQYAK
jgi:phospholipid transport system substrate-binding protein